MSNWLRDMLERSIATYVQTFLGLLMAREMTDVLTVSALQMAAIASLPAALAVVKASVASRAGTMSPGSLVKSRPER
jgi:hypothetical protein